MTQNNLAEQSEAISQYLDSLLNDVDDEQLVEDSEDSEDSASIELDETIVEQVDGVTASSESENIESLSVDMDVMGESAADLVRVNEQVDDSNAADEMDVSVVADLSIELDVMEEADAEPAEDIELITETGESDALAIEGLSINLDVLDESVSTQTDTIDKQVSLDHDDDDQNEYVEEVIEIKPPALQLEGQPDAIIPAWAYTSFQAMLFKVGNLSLALPLTELLGVVEWKDIELTSSEQKIVLGHCQHQGQDVSVVDTARFVFPPERYAELAGENVAHRVSRIVVIQNSHWGLACDSIHEIITIEPASIRWRTTKTRRQWLVGTSVKDMYALLNIEGLKAMLEAENPSG
ncbi:MAG: chemotaxis protein CheW [Gammaproteobacteria bacterium]|nr:chemotaxis protein CheW [Gammaproteobacteria bacterium]